MLPILADYLEAFGSDERFLVFAFSSISLAFALFLFVSGSNLVIRLLLLSSACLIFLAFGILAPLSATSAIVVNPEMSPVKLNYNFGFLALGAGLFLKFRKLPIGELKSENSN